MAVIVSKDKCFVVDGTRMSFNSRDVSTLANGVRITNRATGSYVDIPVNGTTLNGVNATSVQDILDFVDEYFFEIGGGAGGDGGAGLTWDDTSMLPVAGKIPVFSPQGMLSTNLAEFPENAVPLFQFQYELGRKVDKVEGKSLSRNDFNDDYKSKLDAVEDPLFLGRYPNIESLNNARPVGKSGEYAYVEGVDNGTPIVYTYQWVELGNSWEIIHGASNEETPISVKQKYEANPNTNAFTDSHLNAVNQSILHAARTDNPHGVTKSQVGLGNVDNTSDMDKAVSTATAAALDTKENTISAGTTGQYFRGDKTWAQLDKSSVGLSNVDNTSDANKPISTAVQTALGSKVDLVDNKVPTQYLPSYVDNVQEYATFGDFPTTGTSNVIYLAIDTNKPYRWGGTVYVEISDSVSLGETSATAYRGDRGKVAYEHSLKTDNPHGVTKSQVGLGNVDNTSDANKPISDATKTALDAKINAPTTNESVPVRYLNGNIGSFPFAIPATPSTFPFRDSAGRVSVGTPTASNHAVTKEYVDGLTEVVAQHVSVSATQTVTLSIPSTAPDLLRIEIYIPNTIVPAWVGLRVNGDTTGIYKSIIHHVNSLSYTLSRFTSETQLRLLSNSGGAVSNTDFVRIEGTITNRIGDLKIYSGSGYASGSLVSTQPDINNVWGAVHDATIRNSKITQLQFRTNPTNAGFTAGSRVVVYGIK